MSSTKHAQQSYGGRAQKYQLGVLTSRVLIFFLDPRKGISGLPRIETSNHPTTGTTVSGIIVTCCSVLAINRSLVCFTVARIPDVWRCSETKDSGLSKWQGTAGGRRFRFQALITIVTPLHWPGSGNAAASVCLYTKQERPLRCRSIIRLHPTAGLWSPVPRGWSAIASPITFPACVSTYAPQHRRPDRCPPFCVPIRPRRQPIVQWRLTGANGHCTSPVAPSSGCFACATTHGADRSTGSPVLAGNSIGDRLAIAPPFAPLLAIQLQRRR